MVRPNKPLEVSCQSVDSVIDLLSKNGVSWSLCLAYLAFAALEAGVIKGDWDMESTWKELYEEIKCQFNSDEDLESLYVLRMVQ